MRFDSAPCTKGMSVMACPLYYICFSSQTNTLERNGEGDAEQCQRKLRNPASYANSKPLLSIYKMTLTCAYLYLVTRYFEWLWSCIIDTGTFINIADMITDLVNFIC